MASLQKKIAKFILQSALKKPSLAYKYPIAVIDVETTGLDKDRHEIISFSAIKYNAVMRKETVMSIKIRPLRIGMIDPNAVKINGYNEREWAGAPTGKEVHRRIKTFLNGCIVVGHNVQFDLKFLSAFFNQLGASPPLIYRSIDTVTLAHEHLVPCGLESLSLDSIREFMGYAASPIHTARQDARDCYRVYRTLSCASSTQRLYWTLRHRIKEWRKHGNPTS